MHETVDSPKGVNFQDLIFGRSREIYVLSEAFEHFSSGVVTWYAKNTASGRVFGLANSFKHLANENVWCCETRTSEMG